jgi:hypothetical protein
LKNQKCSKREDSRPTGMNLPVNFLSLNEQNHSLDYSGLFWTEGLKRQGKIAGID